MNIHKVARLIAMNVGFFALTFSTTTAQDKQVAKLAMELNTASIRTKGRNVHVVNYLDHDCNRLNKRSFLFNKKYVKDTNNFPSVEIKAGDIVYVQANYLENRLREQRACSTLVAFEPSAGRSYKLIYDIMGQVSKCSIRVVDTAYPETDIPLTIPENSCPYLGDNRQKNGVPVHIVESRY